MFIVYKKMTYGEWREWLEKEGLLYGIDAFGGSHVNCPYNWDPNEEGWMIAEGNLDDQMFFYNWYGRCVFDSDNTTIYSCYGY